MKQLKADTCHNPHNTGPHYDIVQSVTYLTADACITADPGVAILDPLPSHIFVETDHEIY